MNKHNHLPSILISGFLMIFMHMKELTRIELGFVKALKGTLFSPSYYSKNPLVQHMAQQLGSLQVLSQNKISPDLVLEEKCMSQSFEYLGYTHNNLHYCRPFPDPFAVGAGDLNPLAGGRGGGMLMDPRHQRPQIQPGIPGNLPPGAVPPGARFDPFGPPPPEQIGRPRPQPRGGFGDPDPNHLPPPGYYDPFL